MGLLVSTEALEFTDSKYVFEIPNYELIINIVVTILAYWFIMLIPGLLVYK